MATAAGRAAVLAAALTIFGGGETADGVRQVMTIVEVSSASSSKLLNGG
jgi:hypothetical protein